jgi:hypothetical protein
LNNQYRVRFEAKKDSGLQPVKFQTEVPGVKILAPQKVFVKASS